MVTDTDPALGPDAPLPDSRKKVSVLVVTYNQERFIRQTVESALMQQVNFNYEIVIGEDFSTDGTREIVIDLRQKFPDRIRLLLWEQNLGFAGKANFVQTLRACCGEYVAVLEGDDYWTCPDKLQKQVDFLDSHSECVICSHKIDVVYEDGRQPSTVWPPPGQKPISTLEDLLVVNIVPACSNMFRRGLFSDFPEWYYEVSMGDWPLHILNAQYGNIGHLDEAMAVSRFHAQGIWSRQPYARRLEEFVRLFERVHRHLDSRYSRIIRATMARYSFESSVAYARIGEVGRARKLARKCIVEQLLVRRVPSRESLRHFFQVYDPFAKRSFCGQPHRHG
jgi:glycosyltransferase involved in cell wall biosynthesis